MSTESGNTKRFLGGLVLTIISGLVLVAAVLWLLTILWEYPILLLLLSGAGLLSIFAYVGYVFFLSPDALDRVEQIEEDKWGVEVQNSRAANRGDESRGEVKKIEVEIIRRAEADETEHAEETRGAVNEAELIEEIAGKTNTSKTDAQTFFDAFTEVVTDSLEDDEQVQITGFGKFSVQKRDARQDVNIEQLTAREQEVLRLFASGQTNSEISQSLLISQGTVKHHLRNIFVKLRAKSSAEALDKARTAGLLR